MPQAAAWWPWAPRACAARKAPGIAEADDGRRTCRPRARGHEPSHPSCRASEFHVVGRPRHELPMRRVPHADDAASAPSATREHILAAAIQHAIAERYRTPLLRRRHVLGLNAFAARLFMSSGSLFPSVWLAKCGFRDGPSFGEATALLRRCRVVCKPAGPFPPPRGASLYLLLALARKTAGAAC